MNEELVVVMVVVVECEVASLDQRHRRHTAELCCAAQQLLYF